MAECFEAWQPNHFEVVGAYTWVRAAARSKDGRSDRRHAFCGEEIQSQTLYKNFGTPPSDFRFGSLADVY